MMRFRPAFAYIALALIAGCGWIKKESQKDDGNATGDTSNPVLVEASVASGAILNGIADDLSGGTFFQGQSSESDAVASWIKLKNLFSRAPAADQSCSGRLNSQACATTSGERTASYSSCTIGSESKTLSGTVSAVYKDASGTVLADCGLNDPGESMKRQVELTLVGDTGTTLLSSASRLDHRGVTFGGGSTITYLASNQLELAISGITRKFTSSQDQKYNYEAMLRTLSSTLPTLSGGLTRGSRKLDGGQFELSVKSARVVLNFTANAVTWDSASCCHPTSGQFDGSYTIDGDSETRKFAVRYLSTCGRARVYLPGGVEVLQTLPACL